MKIRFKKGDPRAGLVAEFNTSRAREFIDSGAAEEVKARAAEVEPETEPDSKPAKKKAKKKAD